jgi:CubicO group peptidase (beta-lactamase class C family)
MVRNLAVLLISALASLTVGAAGEPGALAESIDAIFESYTEGNRPGCAAGVIRNGKYIHKTGYGLANLEHEIPITSKSVFRIGSVSKQFTAMAIALLAERGDLDLDADVHTYLPDLMDYGHKVTVRQMVHHLAGMGDYDHESFTKANGDHFRFGSWDFWTIEEFFKAVTKTDLVHPPGTKWQYSNLGYFLLSKVVEKVSGKTLREFAAEEIFGPLGMKQTFFNDNVNDVVPGRADGYKVIDGAYEIYMTNLSWVGDGGVYTSLDDFIAWDQNFVNNKLGQSENSLIETVSTAHPDAIIGNGTNSDLKYAFGLFVGSLNDEPVIGHSGSWVGFTSYYFRYPRLSLSVVVFCNSSDAKARELGEELGALAIESVKE